MTTEHNNIINAYITHGWALCPIPGGSKGPSAMMWNTRGAALKRAEDLPVYNPPMGVGLMHAYSGTMAFDIDDWEGTKAFGIDVDALYAAPDAVTILSGRAGRGKLLYRMPFGLVLPTKKFQVEVGRDERGHMRRKVIFELRCGTIDDKTAQDVLPPSIHPDTGLPYQWGGAGKWWQLPVVPQQLLTIWQEAIKDVRPVRVDGVDASWEEIWGAMTHISPDCSRDDWVAIGMALHWAGEQTYNPEQAFHLWDTWSKGAPHRYPGEREMMHQWNSFRTSRGTVVTLGTLYHLARQNGWSRPVPDASTLFHEVTPSAPIDIMSILRPSPPPVPLDLWPDILGRRAQEVSDSVGCDPLVPLWAGLAAVCGAIDARTRLELMPGFQVPPVLWLMTMGNPADKKTPGSRPMLEPLTAIEASDRPRFAQEMEKWEVLETVYSKAKEALHKFVGTSDHQLGAEAPAVPPKPEKPVHTKITVSDVTSAKLVEIAAERPRGVLCYLDEMGSWVGKMINRNSGEDRSAWVVSYEAARYEMDRVARGSIHAENLAISIYGNIQPRVFHENLKDLASDGMLQRFVPAVLRPDQTRLGNPIPTYLTSTNQWENTLRMVYAMPPVTYRLSADAHRVYRSFQEWYEGSKRNERLLSASDTYMTAYGKLEGLVGRLALLFHAIESPFAIEVPASTIERAVRLVRSYVIPVYRHLYDNGETSSTTFDMWVTEHIVHYADQDRITMSAIRASARRPFERAGIKHVPEQQQWITNAMVTLEERGWVARADDGSQEHKGKLEWFINPHLRTMFADYRKSVIKAKADRAKEVGSYGSERGSNVRANLNKVYGYEEIEG